MNLQQALKVVSQCSLTGIFDKLDTLTNASEVEWFLPILFIVFLVLLHLSDKARIPQLELRKWRLAHHYWKDLRDWTAEEAAIDASDKYTHCRPAEFRYNGYTEEVTETYPRFNELRQRKTSQFMDLTKSGYYHKHWEHVIYMDRIQAKRLRRAACIAAIVVICQASFYFPSLIINQGRFSALIKEYRNFPKNATNSTTCSRNYGRDFANIIDSGFAEVLHESRGTDPITTMGYLLFFIFLGFQIGTLAKAVIQPEIPRIQCLKLSKNYGVLAIHLSFIRQFFSFIAFLSLAFMGLTGYTMR